MNASGLPRFHKFELTDRWALITGGAGLLGKEHAKALMEAGANVVLWDVDSEALNAAKSNFQNNYPNRKIIINEVDITDEKKVEQGQAELSELGISISILINNAAINPKYDNNNGVKSFSRIENFDLDDWNLQLKVGLTGTFICSKIFGTKMAENGHGVILNIASDLSIISPDQRLYEIDGVAKKNQPVKPITYSVVKSGLIGLTRYLSTYWRTEGVRVNALSPGGIYENHSQEFVNKINELIPLGRMAKIDEYHSVIQFLCSEASAYMTGQNVVMDGGRTVW